MFVLIPILFGLQQASEGIVWLTIGHSDASFNFHLAVLAYLFFALVFWPSWVPWSILQMEKNKIRRKYLLALGYAGMAASIYAGWLLLSGAPNAEVLGHCVVYSFPVWRHFLSSDFYVLCYAIPTIAPLFVSSFRIAKVTGWLMLTGLILTFIIRQEALTSVWCFSAAVISFFIATDVIAQRRPRANIFFGSALAANPNGGVYD